MCGLIQVTLGELAQRGARQVAQVSEASRTQAVLETVLEWAGRGRLLPWGKWKVAL